MSSRSDPGSKIIDLDVIYVHATERAVLVKTDEDESGVWLPLAQVEISAPSGGELRRGTRAELSAPQWVLERAGLV